MSDLPRILDRAQAGDPNAAEALLPLVYEQFRKLVPEAVPSGRLILVFQFEDRPDIQ